MTPWGGSYQFNWSNSRQQSDNVFLSLNPQYPTSATLNVTQPLWRGLRFDSNRYRIEVARANTKLSREQLRQHVIEQVAMAINAYWELSYAWRNYDVQAEAVGLAEQQYASNRRQVDEGSLAAADVTAAQTQVATFQQNLFAAQESLAAAENNLKTLMLPDRSDPIWGIALIPATSPDTAPSEVGLQDALTRRAHCHLEAVQRPFPPAPAC